VIEIILKGKEEIKKEVARLEPKICYSYSHKLTAPDTLIRVWQRIEESSSSVVTLLLQSQCFCCKLLVVS